MLYTYPTLTTKGKTMKNIKKVIVKQYNNELELTRSEYVEKFQDHSLWLLRDYDDLENTSKMYDEIKGCIQALANLKFNLLHARQQKEGAK